LGANSGFDQRSMIALASSRILELGARCGRVADFPGVDPTSTGRPEGTRSDESFSLVSPYSSVFEPQEDSPLIMGEGIPVPGRERNSEPCIAFP
jgi:hypothetical protein